MKFNQSPQEQKNIEIATVEFKDILQYGHVELAEKVMAPGYIQHNPNVPTGRAAFVDFFSKIRKPEPIKAEPVKAEPAKPQAAASVAAKPKAPKPAKHTNRRQEDARQCLERPTNTEIIKCAEAYL